MSAPVFARLGPCLVLCLALTGCSALSAVTDATESLEIYTLTPARPAPVQSGGAHVVVTPATAQGALMTDRILIRPNRLQAAYLPEGRWPDPAPVMVQSLLVTSLQNSGGFRLVGRDDAGLLPDFTVLTDLRDLQAEAPAEKGGPWTIRVTLAVTVVDEAARSIRATRSFTQTATAPSDRTLTLVTGFDQAIGRILGQAAAWIVAETR